MYINNNNIIDDGKSILMAVDGPKGLNKEHIFLAKMLASL